MLWGNLIWRKQTNIQIPESPAVCTGKEKTWKARVMFEYVQHEVRHILHQMREEGKVLEKEINSIVCLESTTNKS